MKPQEAKQIVASGYDECAQRYSATRRHEAAPELALLTERLPASSRILDIGCGCGIPVTAALAQFGSVVGVDISASQLALARANVPAATFIHDDIMAVRFEEGSFDAIVAFYSLFHVPRDEQPSLLSRLTAWLRPGGYLLASLANTDSPEYTDPDFFGATMYWSHYPRVWYVERLIEAGFEILDQRVLGHGFQESSGLPEERHPLVFAQRGP